MKSAFYLPLVVLLIAAFFMTPAIADPSSHPTKTTVFNDEIECAACGEKVEVTLIGSTNTMGYSDLDMRPAEMQRSTMPMWIQYCPHCGYCASSLNFLIDGAGDVIDSEEYKTQLENENYPEIANHFLCSAMIYENAEEYLNAAWHTVYAAWACDDSGNDNAAVCRMQAVELFETSMDRDEDFGTNLVDFCILTDLLRRSGEFHRAIDSATEALDSDMEDDICEAILEFQIELALDEDSECYTVGDIPNVDELFKEN